MATTTNFGWETPDDTDLVKDGALAMRTLGNSIDTSFVDLKGGTTGQVLSKNSNTDLDFTWVAQDDSNAIQNAIVDAKGDLISATAADTPARLAVGTDGQVLTADSTTATGLKWATAASSSGPAFSVYLNTQQSITASTWVKVQFEVEDFDTDTCYNNSSTYRFTPNKAGYYQFNYNAQVESGSGCFVALYKNGSVYHYGFKQANNQNNHGGACVVAYANGSSDYFEIYANGGTGSPSLNWGTDRRSAFSGVWIRS